MPFDDLSCLVFRPLTAVRGGHEQLEADSNNNINNNNNNNKDDAY